MIESRSEYERSVRLLNEARVRIDGLRNNLRELGLSAEQVKRAVDPMQSFYLQLEEEVENYKQSHGA